MNPPEWLGAYAHTKLTERLIFPKVVEFHIVYQTARGQRVDAVSYVNKDALEQDGGRATTIRALVDQARAQMPLELLAMDPHAPNKPGCKPC